MVSFSFLQDLAYFKTDAALAAFLGSEGRTSSLAGGLCIRRCNIYMVGCAVALAVVICAVLYRAIYALDVLLTSAFLVIVHFPNLYFILLKIYLRFLNAKTNADMSSESLRILRSFSVRRTDKYILTGTTRFNYAFGRYLMAIYVLSDLHLSTDSKTNKSMEVFGNRWQDYIYKIEKNWNGVVTDRDTVIVPGDISWAMKLEDAYSDLKFLNSLNGKKLLGKGNHDFWWATASKMKKFFTDSGFDSLELLYNNAHIVEDRIVCGTRGWFPEESRQITVGDVDFNKIVNREVGRLRLSLNAAKQRQAARLTDNGELLPISVFLHFPPIWSGIEMTELIDVLTEYGITDVYFGHIHSSYAIPASFVYKNIKFTLTSSDFLSFYPLKI